MKRTVIVCATAAVVLLVALSKPATAQTVQFSVYTNWSIGSDGNTLYSAESVIDQSTCYAHSNYVTTAFIYAPDGRQASSQSAGLYANTSMPLNGVSGNYSLVASGRYYCGCSFMNAGFGGSISLPISYAVTYTVKAANFTDLAGYCPQVANCYPYVVPKCNVGTIREAFEGGHPCGDFHSSLIPVVNGACVPFAVSAPVGGPGPCTPK
jgi:hypothetical protein